MTDDQLAEALAQFYDDPLGYVMFIFPWDTEKSIQLVELDEKYKDRFDSKYGPDVWACEFLDDLGEQIRARGFDGRNAVDPVRAVISAGREVGKTAMAAWLVKFILDTRPFSKGVLTANTAEQLKTKTWAEVGKWHKLSLTEHWFNYDEQGLSYAMDPYLWRCTPTTVEAGVEAFAGLQAANSTPFYIFDEASNIPDKVFEVQEGGLANGGEPMQIMLGCPLRASGAFHGASQDPERLRKVVDNRSAFITDKDRIQLWVDEYGEDSDFVRTRVRGLPPHNQGEQT